MHVYIINWRAVHRQYLCNTYGLHIISWLVETSVPLVHETMDTVSEESLGLRAQPFFNGFSDFIVVCEPASLQCFFFLVARTHGNRKVLPLGITAPQPQSHFHLGTSYITQLCTKLVIYPESCQDARSAKHKIQGNSDVFSRCYSQFSIFLSFKT